MTEAVPAATTEAKPIPVDPNRTVTETLEKLGPPSGRHVILLIGAGASMAAGIPGLAELKIAVSTDVAKEMKEQWQSLSAERNLEQVLSYLRALPPVLGTDAAFMGLTSAQALALDSELCQIIAARVSVTPPKGLEAHARLARWLARNDYTRPIEIFTTNYDTLIEQALEENGVPYFDGFVGQRIGMFRGDLVDGEAPSARSLPPPGWVRLWKLHGSIDWMIHRSEGRVAITRAAGAPIERGNVVAIYPSVEKYEESRRLPFIALSDRLRRALALPETVTLTVGYSYRDEHINELLFDSVARFPRSELVALFHGDVPDQVATIARRYPNLTVLGRNTAVTSGVLAEYASEPDGPAWRDKSLLLGDFGELTEVLSRVTSGVA